MRRIILAMPFSLALTSAVMSQAAEHPKEHPTAAPPKQQTAKPSAKEEHPAGHEHPVGSKAWNKQMHKEFNEAVENHVSQQSAGGAFTVKDDKLGKEWALKLVGVHKKRIVQLEGNSFFACADFKTVGTGKKAKLDLDFYATKGPDGWKIDKTVIHKVNGKRRFTYDSQNNMVPVK